MSAVRFGQALTELELSTVFRYAMGLSTKQIARQDGVERSAIINRMCKIGIKLGTRTSHSTVVRAYYLGLFKLDEKAPWQNRGRGLVPPRDRDIEITGVGSHTRTDSQAKQRAARSDPQSGKEGCREDGHTHFGGHCYDGSSAWVFQAASNRS